MSAPILPLPRFGGEGWGLSFTASFLRILAWGKVSRVVGLDCHYFNAVFV